MPFISIKDIKENDINFEDTKFISEEEHKQLIKRCNPEPLDLLLTKVGTIGNCIVIKEGLPDFSIFVSVALLKPDKSKVNPYYLSAFLNSELANFQYLRSLKGIGVPDLHLESIREILVPIPDKQTQDKIAEKFENSFARKKADELKSSLITASLDNVIAKKIGFEFPKIEDKKTFGIKISAFENRLDPHFYLPSFKELLDNIRKTKHALLGDIVEFSKETWNQKDTFENEFPYIEISEIDLSSGKIKNVSYVANNEAPSRAKMVVRENDIIVSTTRPHRGAICIIDSEKDGFIASTGFVILRKLKSDAISKEYLFYILRTQICLLQMLQRSSGGSYPAITAMELRNISIPIPSKDIQAEIVNDIKNFIEKAELLKEEATSEFDKAKLKIETLIIDAV